MKDAALYRFVLLRLPGSPLPLIPGTLVAGNLLLKAIDGCASIAFSTEVTVAQCAVAHNEIRDT
jgi:hypothetical protein